jgi:hypothetical protein
VDKTFGAPGKIFLFFFFFNMQFYTPVKAKIFFNRADGYVYFDLYNQVLGANIVKLYSPLIPATEDPQLCLSFWYAAFGAGDIAVMKISRTDSTAADGTSELVTVYCTVAKHNM